MEKDSKNTNRSLHRQLASIIGVFSFTILTGTILASTTTKAVVDTIVGTLTASCSLAGTGMSTHTTTLNGGVLSTGIGTTNLTATCTDAGGFSIFAVGYSNDTEGTTAMISSVGSTYNIATGTATSGSTSNWAMKVTPGTGITSKGGFNNYSAVPANFTKVAEKASGTQMGTSAAATTTYQIFPTTTQAAGTYTGKVLYRLHNPSIDECPEGYELKSGVCAEKSKTLSTIDNMQEMTSAICTASAENETKQLKDTRDNKLYWVTKLKDGNCWMTQNLDYDISSSINTISNLDGTTGTWTSDSTYPPQQTAATVFDDSTTTGTYSYDPGSNYLPNGTGSATSINCISSSNGGENCHYHLGNYYQWNAATAGTGGTITSTDANSSICPAGWRLPTSKSYTNNYSFGKLTNAYGITSSSTGSSDSALLSSPLWFVRAGLVFYGGLHNQSTYGYVWSSRAGSNTSDTYGLTFYSTYVFTSDLSSRSYGYSVRCVAR